MNSLGMDVLTPLSGGARIWDLCERLAPSFSTLVRGTLQGHCLVAQGRHCSRCLRPHCPRAPPRRFPRFDCEHQSEAIGLHGRWHDEALASSGGRGARASSRPHARRLGRPTSGRSPSWERGGPRRAAPLRPCMGTEPLVPCWSRPLPWQAAEPEPAERLAADRPGQPPRNQARPGHTSSATHGPHGRDSRRPLQQHRAAPVGHRWA